MNLRRLALTVLMLAIPLAACGGDDDADDATGTNNGAETDNQGGEDGEQSATLTLADGTVLDLDVQTCETNSINPTGLPHPQGIDFYGRGPDGEAVFLGIAGTEDSPFVSLTLDANFDAEDSNNTFTATFGGWEDLNVDGRNISGSLTTRAIIDHEPYPIAQGDVVEVDITC